MRKKKKKSDVGAKSGASRKNSRKRARSVDERVTQSKKRSRSTSFGWNWPRTTVQLGYVKIAQIVLTSSYHY